MKLIILSTISIVLSLTMVYGENIGNSSKKIFPKNLMIKLSNGKHLRFSDFSKYLVPANMKTKNDNNEAQSDTNHFKVYPNPSISNYVFLEYITDYTCEALVYGLQQDSFNKTLLFEGTFFKGTNDIMINLDCFKKGVIVIYLKIDGKIFATKIMKN